MSLSSSWRRPKAGYYGWLAMKHMKYYNGYLEMSAVKLSAISKDHRVLEVGFGPGIGIQAAYNIVKDGVGKVCGIDRSSYVIQQATQRFSKPIRMGDVEVLEADVINMPFSSNKFDRVFHCNTYYYWTNWQTSAKELYRVMKPGSEMVTTLCIQQLKKWKKPGGIMYDVRYDPLDYMTCLEKAGFLDVRIEYLHQGKNPFQVIYAQVSPTKQ